MSAAARSWRPTAPILSSTAFDDILDETGKARWLGKMPGSDRRAGKLTHVTMFGLRQARETAKELHERSLANLEEIALYAPGPTQPLREIADMILQRKK